MARALIVGCGCRGRSLGGLLRDDGWAVRGTSRTPEGVAAIETAGLEGVIADPDAVATLLDHVGDATVVCWTLASAREPAAELHGPRLERMLEEIVDTPVRGFVYEARGSVADEALARGRAAVAEAAERWRIPTESITADPAGPGWATAACDAVKRVVG